MDLDTLSLGIGFLFGSVLTGIQVYNGSKVKKIYMEHSKEGITAEVINGLGLRNRYSNAYKIRPEEYDGRFRIDVLSKGVKSQR